MATVEEKRELELKIQGTFPQMQSTSSRGFQTNTYIDSASLQELLEKIVDMIVVEET